MATEFCQRCKQSHPGRVCDYDEKGECAETVDVHDAGDEKSTSGTSTRHTKGEEQEYQPR